MSRYTQLFDVVIEHSYHLNFGAIPNAALDTSTSSLLNTQYTSNQFFTIVPDNNTLKVLAGHKMLFKTTATGFIVGVETDPAAAGNEPLVPIGDDFQLRFAIVLKDNYFLNYSALPTLQGGLFRFSNRSANVASGNFLSQTVADYDTNRTYEAGELYLHTSAPGEGLFQAVRSTGPEPAPVVNDWQLIPQDTYDATASYVTGAIVLFSNTLYQALVNNPSTDLTDATQWLQLNQLPNQYVTRDDYLPLQSEQLHFDLSSAAINQATVSIYRLGDTEVVWSQLFIVDNSNLEQVVLVLNHLPVGAYHIEVTDSSQTPLPDLNYDFYLHNTALNQGWFGVIEIDPGSASFALIDGAGQLNNPSYSINFLNRASRWRYIFPETQSIGLGAEVVQEDTLGQVLVTSDPLPLTRYGSGIALQADLSGTPSVSEEVLLPEPKINRIRFQNAQWFSEIHMSNLPL